MRVHGLGFVGWLGWFRVAGRRRKSSGKRKKALPKLGTGARFKAVEASAARHGARNPAGVAAAVGRRKYGAKRFAAMAAAGRKRRGRR